MRAQIDGRAILAIEPRFESRQQLKRVLLSLVHVLWSLGSGDGEFPSFGFLLSGPKQVELEFYVYPTFVTSIFVSIHLSIHLSIHRSVCICIIGNEYGEEPEEPVQPVHPGIVQTRC